MTSKKSKSKSKVSKKKDESDSDMDNMDVDLDNKKSKGKGKGKTSKKSSKKDKDSYTDEPVYVVVTNGGSQHSEKIDKSFGVLHKEFLNEWCSNSARWDVNVYKKKLGNPSIGSEEKGSEMVWFKNKTLIDSVLGDGVRCSSQNDESQKIQKRAEEFFHAFRVIDREFDPEFICGPIRDALVRLEVTDELFQNTGLLSITSSNVRFPHVFTLQINYLSACGLPIVYDPFTQKLTVYGSKEADLFFWQMLVFSMIEDAGMDPLVNNKKRSPRMFSDDLKDPSGAQIYEFSNYWSMALQKHLTKRLSLGNGLRQRYEKNLRLTAFKSFCNLHHLMRRIDRAIEKRVNDGKTSNTTPDSLLDCEKKAGDGGQTNGLVQLAQLQVQTLDLSIGRASDIFYEQMQLLGLEPSANG